jgi:hypothetical protein
MPKKTYTTREDWLAAAVTLLTSLFERNGYAVPKGVKVTCGWPGCGSIFKRIGECWPAESSEGMFHELFISPRLDDVIGEQGVLATLVHEMVHATVGCKAGHKGPFRKCATALGLEGKMTETIAGAELCKELEIISSKLGPYSHKRLIPIKGVKKQTTRLLKVQCPTCDYVARVTRTHLSEKGAPICPICAVQFEETE